MIRHFFLLRKDFAEKISSIPIFSSRTFVVGFIYKENENDRNGHKARFLSTIESEKKGQKLLRCLPAFSGRELRMMIIYLLNHQGINQRMLIPPR